MTKTYQHINYSNNSDKEKKHRDLEKQHLPKIYMQKCVEEKDSLQDNGTIYHCNELKRLFVNTLYGVGNQGHLIGKDNFQLKYNMKGIANDTNYPVMDLKEEIDNTEVAFEKLSQMRQAAEEAVERLSYFNKLKAELGID